MSDLYSMDHSIYSENQYKIINVKWRFPNFITILNTQNICDIHIKGTDYIEKLHEIDEETKFQFKMQFLGKGNDLIEISYLAPVPMFMETTLRVYAIYIDERIIVTKEYQMIQPNKWQYLALFLKENISDILNRNCLDLRFEFKINETVKVNPNNDLKITLSCDLEQLLHEADFSDVTIKSAEGIEFKAHKAVLSARSPVLRAHFKHNTIESVTNVIQCPYETEVLEDIIYYIYTDNSAKLHKIPEKLLAAADFYQMNRLKDLCAEALQQKLVVDNAIDTLKLAELHSAAKLKEMTLEFINDGNAILITKTEGWAKLESVSLIKTIYEYIFLAKDR